MNTKLAITDVPIHDILARRWSGRAFDRNKPVSRKQLTALLEAARWAPSCYNDQPWRYLVWDRFRNEAAWKQAFDCLGEWNQNWVKNAGPILFLACADSVFMRNGNPNRHGQYDTGAASENICLQAAALGLMAHQMGGFDVAKTRKTFAIPERYALMAMITVGYPAAPDTLETEYRADEFSERTRAALDTHFFEDGWDVPFNTR